MSSGGDDLGRRSRHPRAHGAPCHGQSLSSGAEDGVVPQDKLDELLEAFLQRNAKDLLENLFRGKDQHVEVIRLGQQLALKYKQLYEKELAANVAATAGASGPKMSSAKAGAKHGAKAGASASGVTAATVVANSVMEETKAETDEEESMPTDPSQAMFNEIRELKEQLDTMKEVNRIAEARVEDLKYALSVEEKKHKKEIEELKQKTTGKIDTQDDAHDLRNKVKSADEYKNVLVNIFECKELEYQTQIESMQLEMEEAKRKWESDIAWLEASAREAMERKREDGQQDGIALRQSASALAWLRCPMRSGAGNEFRPMFCQDACWKLISAISGSVALWCSLRDYTIQQASREASRIWSSTMLRGKAFFSLASSSSSATWLKKRLHIWIHQHIVPGELGPHSFIVNNLGREAFTIKNGESFEFTVIAAHFPAETACNRPASLLVILEPQGWERERGSGRTPGPPGGQSSKAHSTRSSGTHGSRSGKSNETRGSHRGRPISSSSSGSSVNPSDSASNVIHYRCT